MLQRITPRLVIVAVLASSVLAAEKKPAAKPAGERFEISFPKEMSAAPLDGHVLLLLSNNDEKEPRFQISFMTAESQQAFGVDVDALAPGAPAVIDATTLQGTDATMHDQDDTGLLTQLGPVTILTGETTRPSQNP